MGYTADLEFRVRFGVWPRSWDLGLEFGMLGGDAGFCEIFG